MPEKVIIPFDVHFSLNKLISFWEKKAIESPDSCERDFAESIVNNVKAIPELCGRITDYSILKKHKSLMDCLLSAVFPSAYLNTNLQAIVHPYEFVTVYSTERFRELFCTESGDFEFNFNLSAELFDKGRIIATYSGILARHYGINMQMIYPLIRYIVDKETGLKRYYKLNMDNRFVDTRLIGTLPEINKEQIALLSENILNITLWNEVIPAENFEFEGFLVVNMFEVTDQEALSMLKQDLLRKDIFSSDEGFALIENHIRTMFRNPQLRLGIASLTNEAGRLLTAGHKIGNSFLLDDKCIRHCMNFEGSIYDRALLSNEPQIIYDLHTFKKCSDIEKSIAELGIRNILIGALEFEGKHIGIVEIGSPNPGDINSINSVKLLDILPLFSVALKRSLEDIENKVQAIIKEECTAVHPSVEWRFRKAALNLIEKEKLDEYSAMEEIVFKDVYPIYALSDIRNSSNIRNNAIQSDLKHNLLLAKDVVKAAFRQKEMPVLEMLNYRIEDKILSLDSGLHSGDESGIIAFLKREVEALFPMVSGYGKNVQDAISKYKNSLDPELGFYYDKRKDYEKSVMELNDAVASYVDEEEERAQKFFPHYFEKYKTDGIEYTIYIGDSISENGGFDELYLKNIRLWQLLMMCNAARKAEEMKSKLSVKLELAHLILAQSMPLSIRFHHDQKKFDVDGTYNVHYEILKKRIDKAELKGKEERLTQPGKLAIVYTQPSEANEYRQYIDFLQSRGYLEEGIEELELKDLQGVYGLRALRVSINMLPVKLKEEIDMNNILNVSKKLINK